jgi:hypothetical protein
LQATLKLIYLTGEIYIFGCFLDIKKSWSRRPTSQNNGNARVQPTKQISYEAFNIPFCCSGTAILFFRLINVFILNGKIPGIIRATDISQGIRNDIESLLTIGSPGTDSANFPFRHFKTLLLRFKSVLHSQDQLKNFLFRTDNN